MDVNQIKDVENRLREKIVEHYSFQQAYMSPAEFDEFVEFRVYNEENQGQWVSTLNALAGGLEGKEVLDVGCGDGGFIVALKKEYKTVGIKGCDLSADNIAMADLRGEKFGLDPETFCLNDVTGLPFDDNSFDVVVMFDVLEHVSNPHEILSEISRVLRSGGCFFSSMPNLLWPKESHLRLWFIHWMPRVIKEWYAMKKGGQRAVDLIHSLNLLSPSDLHSLMKPYFSELSLNDDVFLIKMKSMGTAGGSSIKSLLKKVVICRPVWAVSRIVLKYIWPSIYILSKK